MHFEIILCKAYGIRRQRAGDFILYEKKLKWREVMEKYSAEYISFLYIFYRNDTFLCCSILSSSRVLKAQSASKVCKNYACPIHINQVDIPVVYRKAKKTVDFKFVEVSLELYCAE